MSEPIETQDKVSAALVAVQGELEPAIFDSTNPFLKNKYASLGALIHQSRPVLAKHGLAILQKPTTKNGDVCITTTLVHSSGQVLDGGTLELPIGDEKGKSRAQVAGSLITYLRRYAWASVLGMYADEDTDGNSPPMPKKAAIPRQNSSEPPTTHPEDTAGTFEQAVSQNSPQTRPDADKATSIASSPKIGPKYRLQTLNRLQAAPGGHQRALVHQFLTAKNYILPTEQPEDWPLGKLPKSAEEFVALGEQIQAFEREIRDGREVTT